MRACNNKEEAKIGMDGSIRVPHSEINGTSEKVRGYFRRSNNWGIVQMILEIFAILAYNIIPDNSYNFNTEYNKNSSLVATFIRIFRERRVSYL